MRVTASIATDMMSRSIICFATYGIADMAFSTRMSRELIFMITSSIRSCSGLSDCYSFVSLQVNNATRDERASSFRTVKIPARRLS